MTSTVPASMGGPLSEADRLAEIRARNAELNDSRQGARISTTVTKAQAGLLHKGPADLEFLLSLVDSLQERLDTAAAERDAATARVKVLEGQLATAQAEVVIRDGAIVGRDKAIDSLEAWRRNWKPLVDAHMKRCSGCDACDSEGGDDA